MQPASCVIVRDPFHPWRHAEALPVQRRQRIRALAPRIGDPYICLVNGQPLLRAGWRRRVRRGDVVAFVVLPQGGGGGGSNPLRVVLSLAVMAFAGPLAGALNTSMGLGLAAGSWQMGMLSGAIGLAGNMLVNALVPPPAMPSPQVASAMAAPSPTYSLGAQGNTARLGAAIPVQYGRHVAYMDFAAEPYTEYAGNEQYLYQLFVLGQGEYDIEAIRIEDTPVASFEEVTTEIVGPGGTVTLFPTDVVNSIEVAGQELPGYTAPSGTIVGPFAASAPGTICNYIGIDLVCPRGLYYANDSGSLDSVGVAVQIGARRIDDDGVPLGGWVTLGTETITAATATPQRRSYRYAVSPAGRYEVQCVRTDTQATGSRYGHEVVWAGLRAYLPGDQQYGNVTVIAMRARATNNLSAQSSRRVNVLATRKLPTWHPTTGWSATVATRSIAWAFADACRAEYGGALPDTRIPLAELYQLEQTWAARGDRFDVRFDNAMTIWEALEHIARAGRAKRWMQGGVVRIKRDEQATLPVAMFTPLNITRGSFRVQYLMPTDETADAVEVEYFDELTWKPRQVLAQLPSGTALKPAKLKLFGVTQRAQAWREGMYMAACNRWRRKIIGHGTELEGHIPGPLDLVSESHDMPQWGQFAEAVDWVAGTKTLTVTEPFTWGAGTHYAQLRRRDGGAAGPYVVTAGATDYELVLTDWDSEIDPAPDVGNERERTHVAFGTATTMRQLCRLMSAKPQGNGVVLELVNEDDRVHTADQTTPPADTANWTLPLAPTAPTVIAASIRIVESGSPLAPVLSVSWQPAAGAEHYLVEQSGDGVVWTRVSDPRTPGISFPVLPGPITLRIAAVGLARGAWAESDEIVAGEGISAPPNVTGLALAEAFTGPVARWKWDATPRTVSWTVEVWAGSPLALRRTRTETTPRFAYSAADAKADGGPWRDLTLKVWAVGSGGLVSAAPATLAVSNPQVGALSGITLTGLLASLLADYDRPAVTDLAGYKLWLGTSAGFTPDNSNLVYDGPADTVSIDVNPGSATYYLKAAGYDAWGTDGLTISSAVSAGTSLVQGPQIATEAVATGNIAAEAVTVHRTDIDGSFQNVSHQMVVGTVSVTNGSTAVTGSGTNWTAAVGNNGLLAVDNGSGVTHYFEVATINSTTSATLKSPYTGPTGSGRAYYLSTRVGEITLPLGGKVGKVSAQGSIVMGGTATTEYTVMYTLAIKIAGATRTIANTQGMGGQGAQAIGLLASAVDYQVTAGDISAGVTDVEIVNYVCTQVPDAAGGQVQQSVLIGLYTKR